MEELLEERQYLKCWKKMLWFWQRIRSTNSDDIFVCHSDNVYYKPYIFSKTKSQHEDENVEDNKGDLMVEIDHVPSQSLQASGTLREKPSSRNNVREIKGFICDKFTKNKIYDKYRLEVDSRAWKFLKMAKESTQWCIQSHFRLHWCTQTVWCRFILP